MLSDKLCFEWDGLSELFGKLKNRFALNRELAMMMKKEDVIAQFIDFSLYMNELGNKLRLLSTRLGRDGCLEEVGALVWETSNSIQDEVNQAYIRRWVMCMKT